MVVLLVSCAFVIVRLNDALGCPGQIWASFVETLADTAVARGPAAPRPPDSRLVEVRCVR